MSLSKPFPMLRFGSIGEAVLVLQKALNLAPTKLARLQEDASFGPKTRGRVMEFQGQKHAVQDGVVGPVTWGDLDQFVTKILEMVEQNLPPVDEESQRQRIVNIAQAAFDSWSWGDKGPVKQDGSPRIAAAKGVGPAVGGRRARQGGVTLAAIYAMAGAGGANCLSISTEMEAIYQLNPTDEQGKADRRKAINADIGSWCGIFATYCYRSSGLFVAWTQVREQSSEYFESLGPNDPVKKGDIGVYDTNFNHHFVVVKDAGPGEHVYSIDGNLANPLEEQVAPWNSVIAKRFYLRKTLRNRSGKFLRPKFGAMVKKKA
jgi:hypothetical protein